jgi:hypothetical protein
LAIANPAARPLASGDPRFEPRGRRAPSLATVIVIGFLLVTAVRVIGSLAGRIVADQPAPTAGPVFIQGSDVQAGTIVFGNAADGACDISGLVATFSGGSEIWWSAHLIRGLVGANEPLLAIETRDGAVIQQAATSGLDVGANGSAVVCAIKPDEHATPGAYQLQLWDGDHRELLASGSYTISQ